MSICVHGIDSNDRRAPLHGKCTPVKTKKSKKSEKPEGVERIHRRLSKPIKIF